MNIIEKAKKYVADKMPNVPVPEATVTDVDMKGFSFSGLTLLVKISVSNPYSASIPICEIDYVVKSAGKEVATGKIPDPGSLRAEDKTMLEVTVKLPHSAVVSLVRDVGGDWDIDYVLDLGLIIDLPVIGNITIPLSYAGEMKLPSISGFFGGGGDGDSEDVASASAEVK